MKLASITFPISEKTPKNVSETGGNWLQDDASSESCGSLFRYTGSWRAKACFEALICNTAEAVSSNHFKCDQKHRLYGAPRVYSLSVQSEGSLYTNWAQFKQEICCNCLFLQVDMLEQNSGLSQREKYDFSQWKDCIIQKSHHDSCYSNVSPLCWVFSVVPVMLSARSRLILANFFLFCQ